MITYATTDQLGAWITDGSLDNADALLRSATILVARACERDLYTDSPTGTDAQALADATCAQAATWIALGVDPAKAGTDFPAPVKSSTVLGANVQRDTTAQSAAIVTAAAGLCPLAIDILQTSGLLYVPGPGFQSPGQLPHWGGGQRPWFPLPEPFSGELEWPLDPAIYGDSIDLDDFGF